MYLVFGCDQPAASALHISYKQICAVVSAVDKWRRKDVIQTDSMATKHVVSGHWSVDGLVDLASEIVFACTRLYITLEKGKIRLVHQFA